MDKWSVRKENGRYWTVRRPGGRYYCRYNSWFVAFRVANSRATKGTHS